MTTSPPRINPPPLSTFVNHGIQTIGFWCNYCGHYREHPVDDCIARLGGTATIITVKNAARRKGCTKPGCHSHDMHVQPVWPSPIMRTR